MLLVCDAIKAFYKGIIELMPEFDLEHNLRDQEYKLWWWEKYQFYRILHFALQKFCIAFSEKKKKKISLTFGLEYARNLA